MQQSLLKNSNKDLAKLFPLHLKILSLIQSTHLLPCFTERERESPQYLREPGGRARERSRVWLVCWESWELPGDTSWGPL